MLLAALSVLLAVPAVAGAEPDATPSLPLTAEDLGLDGHIGWADRVGAGPASVDRSTPEPGPTPSAEPRATATPTPQPVPEPEPEPIGIDVSWPQCDRDLPEAEGFAIVGVNRGRVYSANPCLAGEDGQLAWAGEDVQLYLNTGNPGPRDSRHWPVGQDEPRTCDPADPDTVDCAYVYGWNAAEHAYGIALEALEALDAEDDDDTEADAPLAGMTWWLDVEDANSWRRDRERNVAALQGMVDALDALGAGEIGFYSTPRLWNRITGGTEAFAEHAAWHAGASDEADARRRCAAEPSFTGGPLRMVQWVQDGLDRNIRCDA